ncbi:hypothetical protein VB711_08985 [Cronbergia sp. UHCC 0137]|nr:hypothetical protein [Cronbergia sp. UHCC 0137]MEA5617969.1 hypothetical protein [Cronbergia sp. UHCC 0137]
MSLDTSKYFHPPGIAELCVSDPPLSKAIGFRAVRHSLVKFLKRNPI